MGERHTHKIKVSSQATPYTSSEKESTFVRKKRVLQPLHVRPMLPMKRALRYSATLALLVGDYRLRTLLKDKRDDGQSCAIQAKKK